MQAYSGRAFTGKAYTRKGSILAVPPVDPGDDPYRADVVIHVPMLADFSDTVGNTTSVMGSPVISTDTAKFGTASGKFSTEASNNSVIIPFDSSFNLGANDWTLDFWINPIGGQTTAGRIYYHTNSGSYPDLHINLSPDTFSTGDMNVPADPVIWATLSSTGSSGLVQTKRVMVPKGQWSFVEITRHGGNVYMFLNGIRYTLTSSLGTTALYSGFTYDKTISGTDNGLKAYLQDFRLTNGVARHTTPYPWQEPSLAPLT